MDDMKICFPDGTECKVESYSFNDDTFEIPTTVTNYYKGIKLDLSTSFSFELFDCNYKELRRLFKTKYPRKLKKKLFGTIRQRRKLNGKME